MKGLCTFYDKWSEYVARQHFGQDMPNLHDIARNTSLYLVNSHFVHKYAKVLGSNVKEIVGMHDRKPKALPQDFEDWVAGAQHGLIFLNLGLMINLNMAPQKKLAFLEVFAQLPQRALMKWGSETMAQLPKNVRLTKLTKWVPQNDILVLHHPNVWLFITHGGMLSNVEAVHAGVPAVVIPFFGDQLTNGPLLRDRGLGIVLKYNDINKKSLNYTLRVTLFNISFAKWVEELSAAFRDRPVSPLNEAAHYRVSSSRRNKSVEPRLLTRCLGVDLNYLQYLLLGMWCFGAHLILMISYATYKCSECLFSHANKNEAKKKRKLG